MKKFLARNGEWLLVFFFAGVIAFGTIFPTWNHNFKILPGRVHLWVGHYWEDYFQYLDEVDQGARGKWLVENPMTGEEVPKSFIGWGSLLVGQIGRIFGFSAILSYWLVGVLWFNFVCILLWYLLVRRLFEGEKDLIMPAFVVGLVAEPFYWWVRSGEGIRLYLLEHWYSTGPVFNRFGTVPHQVLENILLLGSLLLFGLSLKLIMRKQINLRLWTIMILNGFLLGFDLTLQPGVVLVFFAGMVMVVFLEIIKVFLKKKRWEIHFLLPVLVMSPFLAAAGFYILRVFSGSYFLQMKQWEVATARGLAFSKELTLEKFFLGLGPMVILAGLGVKSFLKRLEPLRVLGVLVILAGIFLFWLPLGERVGLHPMRFISPVMHVFWGGMAILGMRELAGWGARIWRGRKEVLFGVLFGIFLVSMAPAWWLDLKGRVENPNFGADKVVNDLPGEIYQGMMFLRGRGEDEEVVLTNVGLAINTMLPALAAKRVYVGRSILTLNVEKKTQEVKSFFGLKMSKDEAGEFLRENKIKYVLITVYDGGPKAYQEQYDLGKKIFENTMVTIFAVR
jgi:hypothetical protein